MGGFYAHRFSVKARLCDDGAYLVSVTALLFDTGLRLIDQFRTYQNADNLENIECTFVRIELTSVGI